MKIDVKTITELEDGSNVMLLEMDDEMLEAMAKVGLMKVLTDAAAAAVEEHGDGGV